uniref:Uncharacterized protein n=1 Tax=Arundo donax TaxID=35708 RepID=A0A0A9AFW4_ARUDO
MYTQSYQPASS